MPESAKDNGEAYLKGLREDHARFSRVLSMIGRDARQLVEDPATVLPLFSEAVDYVVNFQNVYHHPREEIMFARIAEKSEALAAAAGTLSREHQATARGGEELLSMMAAVSPAPAHRSDREQLARRLERFARSMRRHIRQEEEILYSQAWAELARADWEALAGSEAVVDPLEVTDDSRYPLLAEYVGEGRTRNTVSMESSPLGSAVESGLQQVSAVAGRFGLINRTLRRQTLEACALSRKSIRAMPMIPILQPQTALRVGLRSAGAFGRAYGRWLKEWSEIYQDEDAR
jgi:hemerythrin-like domain-containing protein